MSLNKGEGDGLKISLKKRVPVPSSRKFTANLKNHEDVSKKKLEEIIKQITKTKTPKKHNFNLEKPHSLAEETPTKTNKRKEQTDLNLSIYGTPRGVSEKFDKKQAGHVILHYFLINSWRKTKNRLQSTCNAIHESNNIISQLRIQVDVVNNLRKSESQKREEINLKLKELKLHMKELIKQNDILSEQKTSLRLENNNIKNFIKNLENQIQSLNDIKQKYEDKKQEARRLFEERKCIEEQHSSIKKNLKLLKEDFKKLDKDKQHLEVVNKQIKTEYQNLSEELSSALIKDKINQIKINDLESEKEQRSFEVTVLKNEIEKQIEKMKALEHLNFKIENQLRNLSIKFEEERDRNFLTKLRGVAFSSYSILKKLSRIMLPALSGNY